MKLSIEQLKRLWLDVFFPIQCLGCRQLQNSKADDKHLCFECINKINFKIEHECAFCSSRSQNGATCPFCRKNHRLDYLWAAANYENQIIKKVIWAYKYKFISDLKTPLGQLLVKFLKQKKLDRIISGCRAILKVIPIPLHPYRLNWRSYNQAELLAQEIAGEFDLEVDGRILIRTKNKKAQAEIENKEERMANVGGIFSCSSPEKIKNKIILLVDDIATTGSTLDEAARVLKENGAEKVIGLVVAKG